MKRFITDTTIIVVREHSPIIATRKNGDGSVETVHGPTQWHIVTAPPGPLCVVTERKPDVKVGMKARIVLEVDDPEDGTTAQILPGPVPAPAREEVE